MKFSYNWLQEFLEQKLPAAQELAGILTMHSFEVESVSQAGSDWVLDIDILPNRADCFSHLGLSREIAAVLGLKLKKIDYQLEEDKAQKIKDLLKVEVKAKDLCLRYCARMILNIRVGPSPQDIQQKLEAAGIRAINNIVDATNYVMLELGQPLHAFDADRLEQKHIIVRRVYDQEKFVSLDNKEHKLSTDMLVIADKNQAIALAGVMGGQNTEVLDSTKNIILESANFDAKTIRLAAKQLDLHTESSDRFEHGLDPNLAEAAINRAAYLIQQWATGQVVSGLIDFYPKKIAAKKIKLEISKVESLLGIKVPLENIKHILINSGFIIKGTVKQLEVTVPTYRQDITIAQDLIEEIGRIYGYDKIEARLPQATLVPPHFNEDLLYENRIRETLTGYGFSEVYNYSFISPQALNTCQQNAAELENPVSQDQKYLRPCLIVNLLKNIKDNLRFFSDIRLFEIGRVFELSKGKIVEKKKLAGVLVLDKKEKQAQEFYDLKGVLDALLNKLRISDIWYDDQISHQPKSFSLGFFHQVRRAEIKVGDQLIGYLGKVKKNILESMGIEKKVAVFEIDFDQVAKLATEENIYLTPSKYPSLVRDIAVLVEPDTKVDQVLNIIETAGGAILADVDLFDIYEGQEIPEGKKNLAFHLIYQAEDRTLTEEEVDQIHQKIISALEEEGWEVRR